jgi:hypothetical protein
MCEYLFLGTSNVTAKYNYMSGDGEAGIVCDPCLTGTVSNNVARDMANVGEPNAYPFVVSGDSVSTGVTFQNNSVFNNPVWECYDNHGGTDIHWFNNYCLAAGNNTAINSPGDGGPINTRPRVNGNVIDKGSAACSGCNTIVMVAGGGGALTCTGGDGLGCRVENNIILFGSADSGCGLMATGADGGTLNGSVIVSGNSCGSNPATMAAPVLATDQPGNAFVANQPGGIIGKITVAVNPTFPSWVGGWPNYGGWPGTFSLGGPNASNFQICVDGQHLCQAAGGTAAGSYNITITGTLNGLSNSPRTSATITLAGS